MVLLLLLNAWHIRIRRTSRQPKNGATDRAKKMETEERRRGGQKKPKILQHVQNKQQDVSNFDPD